jgi:hypothetical protein
MKNNNMFGEVIDGGDAKIVEPVSRRYNLTGEQLRMAENVAHLANMAAEKMGLKPVKINAIFQVVFDQAVRSFFEPATEIFVTLTKASAAQKAKVWRLDLTSFASVEDFNERAEEMLGFSPVSKSNSEEGIDDELLSNGVEQEEPEVLEEQEEEETELQKLEREMSQNN